MGMACTHQHDGKGAVAAGILVSIFFVAGWDTSIYLSEETEDPHENAGKAAVIAVALLAVFYFAMVISLQGVVSQGKLEQHSESAAPYLAGVMTGGVGEFVVAVAVLMSVLATTQAFIVATARIAYAMSRDAVLPSVFARVSSHKTPAVGTMILGGAGVALTWVYVMVGNVAAALDSLIGTIALLFAAFYAITGFACIWSFRRNLTRSANDFLFAGLLPMAGSGTMAWVAYKSARDLGRGSTVAMMLVAGTGLATLLYAAFVKKSPALRRSSR